MRWVRSARGGMLLPGICGRYLPLVGIGAVLVVFFSFVYLEGEISRLDEARLKLEQALSRLEVDSSSDIARRSPASYDHGLSMPGDVDDTIVLYNRVPKTGSTSFAGIAYELCGINKFNVLHLNISKNTHVMSVSDQMRFVQNITNWVSKKPAFYHGHLAYLEFSRFGAVQRPIYINIVRDPLDRLISYYYFLRHGDDFRPHLKRKRSGNKETFDECVAKSGPDCDPNNLWMQIPFFCGHAAECWEVGSQWALETAKHNLVNNYLVVGLTEELGDFVAILEAALPRFFTGATEMYNSGRKSHLRKTYNKQSPSDMSVAKIQDSVAWKMEDEFYQFAKVQFQCIKRRTLEPTLDGEMIGKKQQFMYEKIRPR